MPRCRHLILLPKSIRALARTAFPVIKDVREKDRVYPMILPPFSPPPPSPPPALPLPPLLHPPPPPIHLLQRHTDDKYSEDASREQSDFGSESSRSEPNYQPRNSSVDGNKSRCDSNGHRILDFLYLCFSFFFHFRFFEATPLRYIGKNKSRI